MVRQRLCDRLWMEGLEGEMLMIYLDGFLRGTSLVLDALVLIGIYLGYLSFSQCTPLHV